MGGDTVNPLVPGSYVVSYEAQDASGNGTHSSRTVTVVDSTAPIISEITASPNVLWPANYKMVSVTLATSVSDACNATTLCSISVSSNEPINGTGDGDTAPDWEITGDRTLNLRAERAGGGNGRIYAITLTCTDAFGHSSSGSAIVAVPHDKEGGTQ